MYGKHDAVRLRIYIGEDKRHGDRPLYQAVILKARQLHLAGATVLRATQGFGRSTRMHTVDVLFSQDLPLVVEFIDIEEKINSFLSVLEGLSDIGLLTYEKIQVLR